MAESFIRYPILLLECQRKVVCWTAVCFKKRKMQKYNNVVASLLVVVSVDEGRGLTAPVVRNVNKSKPMNVAEKFTV